MTNEEAKSWNKLKAERDVAWQELRDIREAIKADPEESTLDQVNALAHRAARLADQITVMNIRNYRDCQRIDQERHARMAAETELENMRALQSTERKLKGL